MAQRKQLTWTELRVGLFVLAGLFILMVAIFYVTGAGFLGPKYRLVTYLPEVEGMKAGAPVDLDGIEIGNVQSMALTPHPVDHEHNITLVLRVERKYEDQIRTDSTASLVTQGLLGDRYVTITRGLTGSVIPTNGVVQAFEAPDIKQVVQRGADVAENLTLLSNQLNDIVGKVRRGEGSIGKALTDPSLYNHLNGVATKIDAMAASVQQGQGSIGKLVSSDDLYKKADSAMGKIDDTMTAIHDQTGTVGKLIYDPSAYNSIKSVADKGDALLGDVRAGKGTLGKLATDDTAYNNLRDASANVRDATAKLNSNQGTVGKFFSDPAFYDNMTGLSGDLRLMINDFRQNPKKFLHIKLGIF
ncbi:MAG: MlaD family protein [Candidatus Acidiferrales bacterium]|jgi:phospholipid/cholesterol/gamma-HCH transport system substrate-binding protein